MGSSVLPSLILLEVPGLTHSVLNCRARSLSLVSSCFRIQMFGTAQGRQESKLRLSGLSSGNARNGCKTISVMAKFGSTGEKLSQKIIRPKCEEGCTEEEAVGEQLKTGNPLPISTSPFALFSVAPMIVYPLIAEGPGYSQASYYTSLGLFVISVPGIWSLIKRSTKSKIVKKTFAMPTPKVSEEGKMPSQIAGEITSSLGRNNFSIADRGETVTFEGIMVPSRGQAAFLSFCTAVSLGSVALVLSITVPDVGGNWYYLMVLSPLAGFYYWTRASRKEQIKVKMVVSDDESSTDVIIQGDDEQIDRLRRELGLMEKGMVYVKGILER